MNKIRIITVVLYVFLVFGILGSLSLAYSDFIEGNVCPTLLGIPACYIILISFVLLLVLHFFKKKNLWFYIVAFIPLSIAIYGSFFQLLGQIECPKTDSGIPMCFLSLFLFSTIVACKYLLNRTKKGTK